jgi:hypothetical protein
MLDGSGIKLENLGVTPEGVGIDHLPHQRPIIEASVGLASSFGLPW